MSEPLISRPYGTQPFFTTLFPSNKLLGYFHVVPDGTPKAMPSSTAPLTLKPSSYHFNNVLLLISFERAAFGNPVPFL
jgi:hypothetical protein